MKIYKFLFFGHHSEPSLPSTPRNRCTECPDASKTIKNQLPVKKYIGAVVRKCFQLELVSEIGSFENSLCLQKKGHYIGMFFFNMQDFLIFVHFLCTDWFPLLTDPVKTRRAPDDLQTCLGHA